MHLTGTSSAPGPRPGFPYFQLSGASPMTSQSLRENGDFGGTKGWGGGGGGRGYTILACWAAVLVMC